MSRTERIVTGVLAALALWLAANWALALAHALTKTTLILAAITIVALGAPASRRLAWRRPAAAPSSLILLAALAAWTLFVLWRGSVVPPANDDALSYHLPKALLIARAHGVEHFRVPDFRVASFPANYELLLADALLLTGSDRLTEWIGTASYLLFLGVVAMFARRWWGAGRGVVATVMAAAGAPLLLLHSGHDKNDLLTAAFAAAAVYWSARWCVRRGSLPAALAIVFGIAGIGIKVTAAAVAIGALPFGIAALIRRPPRLRPFLGAVALVLAAFVLCGGWIFVLNARAGGATAHLGHQYGEWQHLWELPYLIECVSLGFPAYMPWNGQEWPWPSDNLFSSHYGIVFGVAVLALPFCVWRFRRDGDPELRSERAVASGIAAIGFVVLLPLIQYPQHALPSILRYTIFILPVVLGWTVAPVVRELRPLYANAVMTVLLAIFALNAADAAMNDQLVPLEYAEWCARNPGTRQVFWMSGRAASVVDRMAGPNDTIAMYAFGDAWTYPAYGAALSRAVVFVDSPPAVPQNAQWVIVDQWPAEDERFFNAMRNDPRFRLVYRQEKMHQAVFRRVR